MPLTSNLINQVLVRFSRLCNRSDGRSQPRGRSAGAGPLPVGQGFPRDFLLSRLAAGAAALTAMLQTQIVTYTILSSNLINQDSAHFVRVSGGAVRAPRSAKSFRTPYPRIACPSRPGLIDTRPSAAAGGPARCLREQASVFPAHGPRAGPKGCAGCAGMEAAAAETHRDPATHCPARLSREVLRKPTRRRVGIGTPRSYHGSERGAQTRDNLRLSRVRNRRLKSTITPAYHRVRKPVLRMPRSVAP